MKREASRSTSTIGRDEARKPLMAAYMFQRRMLLGCSVLMVLSLIVWIIAIATDHWVIISGENGIFIPETRRFFMYSHSGLWRSCRHTITPNADKSAKVVRNFTSYGYQSSVIINDAKKRLGEMDFIKGYRNGLVELPLTNFTDSAKQQMFAHWIYNDVNEFEVFKAHFKTMILSSPEARAEMVAINARPIHIDPLDVGGIITNNTFGNALQNIVVNGAAYYLVIPEAAQMAIFENWHEKPYILYLLPSYVKELDIPWYVLNENRVVLQLWPPSPPKKGNYSIGYTYNKTLRCTYIDMFPNANQLRNDPGIDDVLMDYIRSQASFACITVFVMCLGTVFGFYTFLNPRYMFKRLAGGIHLISASTAIVVIQVLISSVDYTKEHLFYAYPDGAVLHYGYGVYLAWFTFAVNLMSGILFIWYSGKKKGAKAPTDELAMADEATIMGR